MELIEIKLVRNFVGPLLVNYIWWVLREANQKKISTLYFLARDGYLLQKIAQQFCDRFNIGITCKYLYCSRAALRIPSYWMLGDEAYDLLLLGGNNVSISTFFDRIRLNKDEINAVCDECKFARDSIYSLLSPIELRMIREKLRHSKEYKRLINEKSLQQYEQTIAYFRQEGLMRQSVVALVDSGWTGSMQRSLRQLLRSDGYSGGIVGFYYGLYSVPKPEDGEYNAWYFNAHGDPSKKIYFCNNLFECLLSAPHGMTLSYHKENQIIVPVLKARDMKEVASIANYVACVLDVTVDIIAKLKFDQFDENAILNCTCKKIKRYMGHPTEEEAIYYSSFSMCDDTTESYYLQLVDPGFVKVLRQYLIPARFLNRFSTKKANRYPELLWPFGVVAFLTPWKRWFYRLNIYIWELMRQRFKQKTHKETDKNE